MSIPNECEVLVVGGGPAGSYAAAALAREGINTVLLEGDVFPRYHVGESMLASMRHFLRFIDLESTFENHGFVKKLGAGFKLNSKSVTYSNFLAVGGPEGYSWNVIRSEADELMFKHAGKSGARVFDGVKVGTVKFLPSRNSETNNIGAEIGDPGRPVSATWSRKDGSSGEITFEYLLDASGRAGLISTKYLKNRRYNQGLKNVANWGYWQGAGQSGPELGDAQRAGQPFFEALSDASGWAWSIPLHNSTLSVGVVMNQDDATSKKRAMHSPSSQGFYLGTLKLAPGISRLLLKATLVSDIKSGSDWSYSASTYASPFLRIVGDAGSFIDPFFSSGVHLALASALSAAVTICAAKRGNCDERAAATWHSKKVAEGYIRFLLVVLSAQKQIRQKDEPVLNDWDEQGFERAFELFRPIIQGTTDTSGKLTQEEISKTVDFCINAWIPTTREQREAVLRKVESDTTALPKAMDARSAEGKDLLEETLSPEEMRVLNTIRARKVIRFEDLVNLNSFGAESIDGMTPCLKKGNLGLVPTTEAHVKRLNYDENVLGTMNGEDEKLEEQVPILAH